MVKRVDVEAVGKMNCETVGKIDWDAVVKMDGEAVVKMDVMELEILINYTMIGSRRISSYSWREG